MRFCVGNFSHHLYKDMGSESTKYKRYRHGSIYGETCKNSHILMTKTCSKISEQITKSHLQHIWCVVLNYYV